MKKIAFVMAAALTILFASCASMGGALEPLDQGFFPIGGEPEVSVEITVGPNLIITGIDKGNDFSFNMNPSPVEGFQVKKAPRQEQIFRLTPGVHTVNVIFNSGSQYTMFSNTLIINLEEGNHYRIDYETTGDSIKYTCVNSDTNESALLDRAALAGKTESVMSAFIGAVLNPTMDEVGQTVIQENDDYILTTYPGLKFELTDKASGTTEAGMTTFVTDFTMTSGTVYFCITDITDVDEFLDSDYKNNSKYIFTVTACDRKTVTYTYQKPEDKADQTITFNVSVKE